MSDIINRLAHGYVVFPVLSALIEKDFFVLLRQTGGCRLHTLAALLHAREGPLLVSLRVLEIVGLVQVNKLGEYTLCSGIEKLQNEASLDVFRKLYSVSLSKNLEPDWS